MTVLVTGGAGFIGSHLVDKLIENGKEVTIFDNLSTGRKGYVNEKAQFIEGDMLNTKEVDEACKGVSEVWHLAANYNVRISDPQVHFKQNTVATLNLLESMRKNNIHTIYFTSTSVVYGEAMQMPTSENYGPLIPISVYGGAKLAAESLIMAHCHTFDMHAILFRLANIIGGRSDHGVVPDFIKKLKQNQNEIEILGDGRQCKSYLHVSDCVNAMFHASAQQKELVESYNVGSNDKVAVNEIVDIVTKEMQLSPRKTYTGGRQGWKGDVPLMLLSIEKLKSIGWTPTMNSQDAVKKTVQEILGKV